MVPKSAASNLWAYIEQKNVVLFLLIIYIPTVSLQKKIDLCSYLYVY